MIGNDMRKRAAHWHKIITHSELIIMNYYEYKVITLILNFQNNIKFNLTKAFRIYFKIMFANKQFNLSL